MLILNVLKIPKGVTSLINLATRLIMLKSSLLMKSLRRTSTVNAGIGLEDHLREGIVSVRPSSKAAEMLVFSVVIQVSTILKATK